MLERRHIEIAEQNHAVRVLAAQSAGCAHFVEKGKLVREFRIDRRVGEVAAGGYVEVVQRDGIAQSSAFAEHCRDVPTVALAAKRLNLEALERQAREQHDAVIALLPIERHVVIAEALEALERKPVVGTLGLL